MKGTSIALLRRLWMLWNALGAIRAGFLLLGAGSMSLGPQLLVGG